MRGTGQLELPHTVSGSSDLSTDGSPVSLECCLYTEIGHVTLEHITPTIVISRGHRREKVLEY